MNQDSKNKWSVIINIALTTITAVLSALGFTIGWHSLWQTHEPPRVVRGCFLSTDHTENTEKDFRRMIKTTPSDFKPQTSDFIFALQALQYNNITVSYTHFCVTVVTVTVLKKQKQVRLDLMNRSSTKAWLQKIKTNDNFFFPHLLIFHFIFINLHGKS